jgi:hypothetical protein
MMNFVKQGYSVFLWNKAIAELKKSSKSSQEFIQINQIKDINDLFSFLRRRNAGYTIRDFNLWINSNFSETVYDIVYL